MSPDDHANDPAGPRVPGKAQLDGSQLAGRLVIAGVSAAALVVVARVFGYKVYGNVVVRCRRGHEFATFWVPGVKMRSLDLIVARVQRCPVGLHWSLVVPVRHASVDRS